MVIPTPAFKAGACLTGLAFVVTSLVEIIPQIVPDQRLIR